MFRTGEGTKLHAASNGAVIAFELDDYDPATAGGWSVLAIGRARVTEDAERAELAPLLTQPSVTGDRDHFVGLTPELLSGRRIVH